MHKMNQVLGDQQCWAGRALIVVGLIATALLAGCKRSEPAAEATPAPAVDVAEVRGRAEGGDREAQRALGDLYAAGRGVPQDFKLAAEWYRKAAEQGSPAAQNGLGELFEAGQGVPHSYVEAEAWYRKAAEQSHVAAQYNLAVLHAFGRGVPINPKEAVKWYRAAAEQGHALAQFNIGQRYELGKGVGTDLVEAYQWLSLAGRTIPDSANLAEEVKSKMTREQVAEAKRRIAAFQTERIR